MENKEIKFGIQECSKCRYYLRCDECVYNKKGIENIVNEARKETAKEILQVIEKAKENGQIYYNESFMITAKGAYGVEE